MYRETLFAVTLYLPRHISTDNEQLQNEDDITKGYFQFRTPFEREVYIRTPIELGLPIVFHHLETLKMKVTRAYLCVCEKKTNGQLDGLVLLQADDYFRLGSTSFRIKENDSSKVFRTKPRIPITTTSTSITDYHLYETLTVVFLWRRHTRYPNFNQRRTKRHFLSGRPYPEYVAVDVRKNICTTLQFIETGNIPTDFNEHRALTKAITFLRKTKNKGLEFLPLGTMKPI